MELADIRPAANRADSGIPPDLLKLDTPAGRVPAIWSCVLWNLFGTPRNPTRQRGAALCPRPDSPRMRDFQRMIDRLWSRLFQGQFEDRPFAIDTFNRHNDQVRQDVAADCLLVYDISEGWGPLCAFLDVPVPDGKPFPYVNSAAEFRARIERTVRVLRIIGYSALAAAVLLLVVAALAVFRLWG